MSFEENKVEFNALAFHSHYVLVTPIGQESNFLVGDLDNVIRLTNQR